MRLHQIMCLSYSGFYNLDAQAADMVVLLLWPSQLTDSQAKGLDLIPVGKIDIGIQVRRSFGYPHNEANHGPVPESVLRVVNSAPKNADDGWLPGDGFEELSDVGIAVCFPLFRFARDCVD